MVIAYLFKALKVVSLRRQAENLADSSPSDVGYLTETELSLMIPKPSLWSAESPHIYTLVLVLKERGIDIEGFWKLKIRPETGRTEQAESCRVGFREISIEQGQLRVNGRPIHIRGVNRHEHDELRCVWAVLIHLDRP